MIRWIILARGQTAALARDQLIMRLLFSIYYSPRKCWVFELSSTLTGTYVLIPVILTVHLCKILHCFTWPRRNTGEKTGAFIYSSTSLHRNSFLINGITNLFSNEFSKICYIITSTGLF